MFMLWLYRVITGYVKFKMEGGFPERLLNMAAAKGITIWNVKRKGETIFGCVLAKQYPLLRPLVRKSGVKMRHIGCVGFSFVKKRYKKRVGIPVGAVLAAGIIYTLSCFVWNVNVIGNDTISKKEILNNLQKVGVKVGVPTSSIDVRYMRQDLMLLMPNLSWSAINIKGSVVNVDVRETTGKPEFLNQGKPCNVKAQRDGIILKILPYQGIGAVDVGTAVVKGDLLISGAVEYETGITKFVHARGNVIAQTERTLTAKINYNKIKTVPFGKTSKRRVLSFFWWDIPLFLGEYDGEYQIKREIHKIESGGISLPVYITQASITPLKRIKYKISKNKAIALCEQRIIKRASKLPVNSFVEKSREIKETKKGVTMSITYLCEEDIAYQEDLLIN